jgi:hypothetical protein
MRARRVDLDALLSEADARVEQLLARERRIAQLRQAAAVVRPGATRDGLRRLAAEGGFRYGKPEPGDALVVVAETVRESKREEFAALGADIVSFHELVQILGG